MSFKDKSIKFKVESDADILEIVAYKDDEIVGNVSVHEIINDDDCYNFSPYENEKFHDKLCGTDVIIDLTHLHVEPEYRRSGLATELMTLAMKKITQKFGRKPMFINASPMDVELPLEALVSFYEKFGFKLLKKYPEHNNAALFRESSELINVDELASKYQKYDKDRDVISFYKERILKFFNSNALFQAKPISIAKLHSPHSKEDLNKEMDNAEDEKYAEFYAKKNGNPPPIIVSLDGEIIDGRHRTRAAILNGKDSILAWQKVSSIKENDILERIDNKVLENKMDIAKGDTVKAVSGHFKGKTGEVVRLDAGAGLANVVWKGVWDHGIWVPLEDLKKASESKNEESDDSLEENWWMSGTLLWYDPMSGEGLVSNKNGTYYLNKSALPKDMQTQKLNKQKIQFKPYKNKQMVDAIKFAESKEYVVSSKVDLKNLSEEKIVELLVQKKVGFDEVEDALGESTSKIYDLFLVMEAKKPKLMGSPEWHQHKIAVDTVKNPAKSLLGGMDQDEAENILKKKFQYSDDEIKKLKEDKEGKWVIRDWAGNYPFEKNKNPSAVKLGGGPVHVFDSFEDAEEFLSNHLGDEYETDREEYEIEMVEESLSESNILNDPDMKEIDKLNDEISSLLKSNKPEDFKKAEELMKKKQVLMDKVYDIKSFKEDVGNNVLSAIKSIVMKKAAGHVGGQTLDLYTASTILRAYNKLTEPNKSKLLKFPVAQMADISFQLLKKGNML